MDVSCFFVALGVTWVGPITCDAMKPGSQRLLLRLFKPLCEVWQGGFDLADGIR
jgi:hypothetical protein